MVNAIFPKLINGAWCWTSGLNIDADGCPIAYAPADSGLTGLDYLANAGKPGNWYGLVTDIHGNPVIQGPSDPSPGYYISATALCDHTKKATDPNRYVDSTAVSYISIPPELRLQGVKLGDICMVFYGTFGTAAIVADIGPHKKYGEGSIALAAALNIPSSPKNGGVDSDVIFIVFPNTTKGYPNPSADDQAIELYNNWGGDAQLDLLQQS